MASRPPPARRGPLLADEAHAFHELVVLLRGSYRVRVAEGVVAIGAGEAVYHPPGAPHRVLPPTESGDHGRLILQWDEDHDGQGRPRRLRDAQGRLVAVLLWMWDLRPAGDPLVDGLQQALTTVVVGECLRLATPAPASDDRLARMLRHLHGSPATAEQRAHLASLAGVGARQVQRLIRSATGETASAIGRRRRLEAVLHGLRAGRSLSAVASASGFPSPDACAAFLRRLTGRGPRALAAR